MINMNLRGEFQFEFVRSSLFSLLLVAFAKSQSISSIYSTRFEPYALLGFDGDAFLEFQRNLRPPLADMKFKFTQQLDQNHFDGHQSEA